MSAISRVRKQTAVWFKKSDVPSAFGNFTYHLPEEFQCRWDASSVEFVDPEGANRVSKAVVICDREMDIGDILILCTLEDPLNTEDPASNQNAFSILRFDAIPDRKAKEYLYIAYLG